MRFLSNAHTHTPYCDGKTPIGDMVEAAKALGFVSLGFSGHGDQGFDPLYSMTGGRQEQYESQLRALQGELRQRDGFPRLWVGVEEDTLTPAEKRAENRLRLDYRIVSTHYLSKDFHGQPVSVDGEPTLLAQYIRERLNGDGLALAKDYFRQHVNGLLSGKPDIIGHFDLVRKYAAARSLFDEKGAAYRKLALDALEQAFPCGGVLELNTGGMARSGLREPYPTPELLGAWRELGGQVTVTSDCHDSALLDYAFDTAARLLAKTGYTHALRLGTGAALWEDVRVAALRG